MLVLLVRERFGLRDAAAVPYHATLVERGPGQPLMQEGVLRRQEETARAGGANGAPLADLLHRIAGGDRSALRRLYDLQSPRLFAVALRITRDSHLASDALHDAFMQVLKQAGRFDPGRGNAEAWLVSLVRYRALDIVRSRRREVSSYEPADEPGFDPDALEILASSEEGQALRSCLGQLEEDRRQLIVLAFVEGLSHSELAARLKLPLGTVKSAIRRGLRKLRECLEQ